MATNNCVDTGVPDSMIGATRRTEATAKATAKNFIIELLFFGGLSNDPLLGRELRRRRSASQRPRQPAWNRIAARLSLYSGSYSVKRMDCPHAAHRRPLPRQIQIFAGASKGSTPASTFSRTRSASDFATGSSPEGMKLAPDDPVPQCSSLLHAEPTS